MFLFSWWGRTGRHERLSEAIRGDSIETIRELVREGAAEVCPAKHLREAVKRRRLEVVEWLLTECGVDVAAAERGRDRFEEPVIITAVKAGDTDIIRCLVEDGHADLYSVQWRTSPLCFAAENGLTEVVRFLIEEMKVDVSLDAQENTKYGHALMLAAERGHVKLIPLLLPLLYVPNVHGDYPYHEAARFGRLAVVRYFVEEAGVNPSLCTRVRGQTALHLAAARNHRGVANYLLRCDGSLLEKPDSHGETPILSAAAYGQMAMVKWLLEQGADIGKRDTRGWTILHHAVHSGIRGQSFALVKWLIEDMGVNAELRTNDGKQAHEVGMWQRKGSKLPERMREYLLSKIPTQVQVLP